VEFDAFDLVNEGLDLLGLDGRPLAGFSQVLMVVEDRLVKLVLQIVFGKKVPTVEDMLGEDAEPDFNGVEKGDSVSGWRQNGCDAQDHSGTFAGSA
jgi:hypothetical protein